VAAVSFLLDTHALLWWLFDDPELDRGAYSLIGKPEHAIYVSSVSAWEISTKHRIGKLPEAAGILKNYRQLLVKAGFRELAITTGHALAAGALPGPHRDPFDRMLIAQSKLEQMPVVTRDPVFKRYRVRVIHA
jgi:PIN domain nuclease of toxin-antitoxin system